MGNTWQSSGLISGFGIRITSCGALGEPYVAQDWNWGQLQGKVPYVFSCLMSPFEIVVFVIFLVCGPHPMVLRYHDSLCLAAMPGGAWREGTVCGSDSN